MSPIQMKKDILYAIHKIYKTIFYVLYIIGVYDIIPVITRKTHSALVWEMMRYTMAISYNKLWKLLIDKGISKTELKAAVRMSPNTLAKLGKNETVSLDVLVRICEILHCDIGDIVELIPDQRDGSELQ